MSGARSRSTSRARRPLAREPSPEEEHSTGIISNIFNYVSREVRSFVVSATGGQEEDEVENEEPPYPLSSNEERPERTARPSSSRTRETVKLRARDKPYKKRDKISSSNDHPNLSIHREPEMKSLRSLREDLETRREPDARSTSLSSRRSSLSTKSNGPARESTAMPGGLFSLAASPPPEDTSDTSKRVHFTPKPRPPKASRYVEYKVPLAEPDIGSTRGRFPSKETEGRQSEEEDPYAEETRMSQHASTPRSSSDSSFSRRSQSHHSMRVAEQSEDREPALGRRNEPSDQLPPVRYSTWSAEEKGKGKAKEVIDLEASPRARHRTYSSENPKSRRSRSPSPASPPPESIASTSITRHPRPRDDTPQSIYSETEKNEDKLRIQRLEEEIQRLRDELARRPASSSIASNTPPPPPPPPPQPPSGAAIRAPTFGDKPYALARASLKQTQGPIEHPIVSSMMANRNIALPTVPADKMAEFLNELKTVRLRKVKSGNDMRPGSGGANQTFVARSSGSQEDRDVGNQSWSVGDRFIGMKRKRSSFDGKSSDPESTEQRPKRQFLGPGGSLRSTSQVRQSSKLSTVTQGRDASQDRHGSTETSSSMRYSTSMSVQEHPLNIPTPSLCSDNEAERDEDRDRAPSTPPLLPVKEISRKGGGTQVIRDPARVQPQMPERPTRPRTADADDPFSRRLPSSPIVPTTTKKPKPPGRPSQSRAQSSTRSDGTIDRRRSEQPDEDPFLVSHGHVDEAGSSTQTRRTSDAARRRTLDMELLRAVEKARSEDDFESGLYFGVGTRSKEHGFLAHGGGGGPPVFMGEGYVEGAVPEHRDSDLQRGRSARRP
ncbi:hypothetical protein SISNIDRAFT_455549 [Sistotremastrum niveocremeum HHB9708]|uniref:Uncharacterized protein n=1 Tax=Sistotremastrum niveocremeum HHB9708 TaxID=1314777 RepID=A0A164TI76_9AGAM|nr:hypothetical protein SISNIDRAFT_455549 [Sistotremastrum niveocremeum HHB9708]